MSLPSQLVHFVEDGLLQTAGPAQPLHHLPDVVDEFQLGDLHNKSSEEPLPGNATGAFHNFFLRSLTFFQFDSWLVK